MMTPPLRLMAAATPVVIVSAVLGGVDQRVTSRSVMFATLDRDRRIADLRLHRPRSCAFNRLHERSSWPARRCRRSCPAR